MKILAIETSCEHASVALLADECVRQRTLEGQGAHSERLLGEIRALLAEGGTPEDLLFRCEQKMEKVLQSQHVI